LESADGKTLYYTKQSPNDGVWEQPVAGGPEKQVIPHISAWGNFALSTEGIYFSTTTEPRSVQFYDLKTRRTKTVVSAPKNLGFGLTVSPDGRMLLFTSVDQQENELLLVENFR
ncbi:MAG TPA: hypothetical protein VE621_08230, partial [Bryobacteraceae bacterium]|nr:hypothetical protein [Bryobacteraceae bacterium]